MLFFFFSSRRRHTRLQGDWSSDVCSSDLAVVGELLPADGAEDGVVENLGLLDVDGADGDVADHGSLPEWEPSLAGKWNKSRTIQCGRFKQPLNARTPPS